MSVNCRSLLLKISSAIQVHIV